VKYIHFSNGHKTRIYKLPIFAAKKLELSRRSLHGFFSFNFSCMYLENICCDQSNIHPTWLVLSMGPLTIKTPNPQCRLFLKTDREGTWRQVFICLRPSGIVKQFFWFGIWSNTHYTVYNSCICSPHNPPPPPVAHCINTYLCTYSHKEEGEGGGRRTSEKVRGATGSSQAWSKIPPLTDCISSL
jgi:hypothetical protein